MRNFNETTALLGAMMAGIATLTYVFLEGGVLPEQTSTPEDELVAAAYECGGETTCLIWIREGVAQVIPMRNRHAKRAIELKLPHDSPILNIGSVMCGHESCEIIYADNGITIRKYERDAVTFVRENNGRYSAHLHDEILPRR